MNLFVLKMQLSFVSSGLGHDRSSRKPPAWWHRRLHPGSFSDSPEHRGPHSHLPDDPRGRWVADPEPAQRWENGLRIITSDWFRGCIWVWWQIPDCSVSVFTGKFKHELDWWCCELISLALCTRFLWCLTAIKPCSVDFRLTKAISQTSH